MARRKRITFSIDGRDLAHLLWASLPAPIQALELVTQVCEALQFAHLRGVIHRDIKPANILVTRDHRVKLVDFGLARSVHAQAAELTASQAVMGTLDYMEPELRNGAADARTDIYALGVTFYEMLTGVRPRGVFDPPSRMSTAEVDMRLDAVVLRALQQNPARRYVRVSKMKSELERIRADWTPTAAKRGELRTKAGADLRVAKKQRSPTDFRSVPVKAPPSWRMPSLKLRLRVLRRTIKLSDVFAIVLAVGGALWGIDLYMAPAKPLVRGNGHWESISEMVAVPIMIIGWILLFDRIRHHMQARRAKKRRLQSGNRGWR